MRFVGRFEKIFRRSCAWCGCAFVLRVHAGRGNSRFRFLRLATGEWNGHIGPARENCDGLRFSELGRICGRPCRADGLFLRHAVPAPIRDNGHRIRAFLAKTALWCRGRTRRVPMQKSQAGSSCKAMRAMKVVGRRAGHLRA